MPVVQRFLTRWKLWGFEVEFPHVVLRVFTNCENLVFSVRNEWTPDFDEVDLCAQIIHEHLSRQSRLAFFHRC